MLWSSTEENGCWCIFQYILAFGMCQLEEKALLQSCDLECVPVSLQDMAVQTLGRECGWPHYELHREQKGDGLPRGFICCKGGNVILRICMHLVMVGRYLYLGEKGSQFLKQFFSLPLT